MELLREFLARSLERKFVFFTVALVAIAIVSVTSVTSQGIRHVVTDSFQNRITAQLACAVTVISEGDAVQPDIARARRVLAGFLNDPDLVCLIYRPSSTLGTPIVLEGSIPAGVEILPEILHRAAPIAIDPPGAADSYLAWTAAARGGGIVAIYTTSRTAYLLTDVNVGLLQVAAIICILSCFVGLFMARLILRPLERSIAAMREVAEGKEIGQLPALDRNELGEWTRTFNFMLAKLRHSHNLEKFLLHREKNELVVHIAAGLAHRIRTPLTSISSLTQLIAKGGERNKLKEWGTVILTKVQELDGAVSQFLNYARPGELRFSSCNLSETIAFALGLLGPDLAESGLTVEARLDCPGERPLLHDSPQLQQAFINLFRSSARAMKPGGRLRVELVIESAAGPARVRIADTGEPIPEELRDHVFEPFVDMTNRHAEIGLPVAARLFEMHGGGIWLERSDASGNCFVVTLPFLTLEELKLRSARG